MRAAISGETGVPSFATRTSAALAVRSSVTVNRSAPPGIGLDAVADEIREHLAKQRDVDARGNRVLRRIERKVGAIGELGQCVELVPHHLDEVDRRELHLRQARELAELVHRRLQVLQLLADHRLRLVEMREEFLLSLAPGMPSTARSRAPRLA